MGRTVWLVSAPYDLSFIVGSAVLLLVPHAVHVLWSSAIVVDLVIAAAIGGPHLFATYTLTFMEPNFRRRYPRYTIGALLLPVLVLVLAIVNLDLLVTVFFFMAALHVIHQAGYVADSYRDKCPEPPGLAGFSRGIDYGLLASSLFVLATFKFTGAPLRIFGMDMSRHPFNTGGRQLLFPGVLQQEVFAWAALLVFVLCAAAFVVKCGYEIVQCRLSAPKTLHMTLAREPVLHHPRAAEPGHSVPGTQHLALLPVPGVGYLPQPLPAVPRHDRLRYGRPLRRARLALVRRLSWPHRCLRPDLPRPARDRVAGRRLAGRRDATALLLLLRLCAVRSPDPLLLRPLPLPPHRRRHLSPADGPESAHCDRCSMEERGRFLDPRVREIDVDSVWGVYYICRADALGETGSDDRVDLWQLAERGGVRVQRLGSTVSGPADRRYRHATSEVAPGWRSAIGRAGQ